MAWKKYTLATVLLLIVWAIVFVSTMPMKFLLDQARIPPHIGINAISGTLWSGYVEIVWSGQTSGNFPIIASPTILIWRLCPLQGGMTMCITLDNSELKGDIYVSYLPFDNQVRIHDTVLTLDITEHEFSLRQFPLSLSGNGQINLHTIEIPLQTRVPSQLSADGNIFSLRSGNLQIGEYQLQSDFTDYVLNTEFAGGTDDFIVKGEVALDFGKNSYRYYADLKSESEILINLLKPYAQEKSGSKVTFFDSGSLFSRR